MESRHDNHPPCDVVVMLDFMAFFDQFELIAEQLFLFLSVDFIKKGFRRVVQIAYASVLKIIWWN